MSPPALACVVAVLAELLTTNACAELSGSIALVSDYRYRGVSLSAEKPAAQFGLAYDHPQGWYTGALLSTVQFDNQSRRAQLLPYLGYVRTHPGFSWEMGADYYSFAHNHDYDFPELYFGITANHLSGRIYYARNYFGESSDALYIEVNVARPLLDRLTFSYHIGVLRPTGAGGAAFPAGHYRYDLRAGLGTEVRGVNVQLAWTTTDNSYTSAPVNEYQHRNTFVLSLSRSF